MKSLAKHAAACALLGLAATACTDVTYPDTPTEPTVTEISYAVSDRSVTLSWQLPAGDITAVRVYGDNVLLAELPATETTYTVARQKANIEVLYTVKLVYANDIVSLGKTIGVTIEAAPAVPAMLIDCATVAELTDDDEVAAAAWFAATYPQGKFIYADTLTALDPDKVGMLWVNIDREGLAQGWRKLPKVLTRTSTMTVVKDFMALGGNVLLTKHATQMVVPMGLVDAIYAPNIFGADAGGEGTDNWAFNANIGLKYNHATHPIFKGLKVINDYGHDTFALIGPGWREDHNCMWDLNGFGLNPDPNTVESFEKETHSTVLGTWAHVTDFAVAGIVEFNRTDERPGKCIAIGLAAYEFKQNSGTNIFQDCIEALTANCIAYLNN